MMRILCYVVLLCSLMDIHRGYAVYISSRTYETPLSIVDKVGTAMLISRPESFINWEGGFSYGGAATIIGFYHAKAVFSNIDDGHSSLKQMEAIINSYLDRYKLKPDNISKVDCLLDFPYGVANLTKSCGYHILNNLSIPSNSSLEGTVGDHLGLFPLSYLLRFRNGNFNGSKTDLLIATRTADRYVLGFKSRLSANIDLARPFSRTSGDPREPYTGNPTFLWSDDQYMGLVLLSRLAADTEISSARRRQYVDTVASMQLSYTRFLRDPVDGLYYHGANALNGHRSCCKWGRANAWGMLSHSEVLRALGPLHPKFDAVLSDFQSRAEALSRYQDEKTGLWHQVVNETSTFLETSVTAMSLAALASGIHNGYLMKARYKGIILKAYKGLLSRINNDGTVRGICMGTGIGETVEAYNSRGTNFSDSPPGGAGFVLSAVAAIEQLGILD